MRFRTDSGIVIVLLSAECNAQPHSSPTNSAKVWYPSSKKDTHAVHDHIAKAGASSFAAAGLTVGVSRQRESRDLRDFIGSFETRLFRNQVSTCGWRIPK